MSLIVIFMLTKNLLVFYLSRQKNQLSFYGQGLQKFLNELK